MRSAARLLASVLALAGPGSALAQSPQPVMPIVPGANAQAPVPKPASKEVFTAPLKELPTPYTPGVMGANPPTSNKETDVAFGAYQRGQYTTALREATKRLSANSRDAAAMTLLGELNNQGLGIKQDPVKAAEWYRLAAAQGDVHAMASLGLMSIDGRGGPKDLKAGRRWLEQASDKGEATASYNLALILLGSGTEADQAKADKPPRENPAKAVSSGFWLTW